MTEHVVAPYGEWMSPIDASDVAAGGGRVGEAFFVDDDGRAATGVAAGAAGAAGVWWLELVAAEAGRMSVRGHDARGAVRDILPAPWNARSRVHEYGGGAWTPVATGLAFVEFTDQRVYRLDVAAGPDGEAVAPASPVPLTPSGGGMRFGGLRLRRDTLFPDGTRGDAVLAVRETHHGDGPSDLARDLVLVPLDGRAAEDASRIVSVVAGSWFLAQPEYSPDGTALAWIAWDHPNMPWDGTELRVGETDAHGRVTAWRTVAGGPTESVLEPRWAPSAGAGLYVLSDRSGWWNVHRVDLGAGDPAVGAGHDGGRDGADGRLHAVTALEEDLGGPLWSLDGSWYRVLADGTIVAVATRGVDRLLHIDPRETPSVVEEVPTPFSFVSLLDERDGVLMVASGSAAAARGIRTLRLDGRGADVRVPAAEGLPAPGYLSDGEVMTFRSPARGGTAREVHAVVYRPRNADFAAPEGELPPFLAFVHGGPTAHSAPELRKEIAFFTSRGIGVVDVNYGGSSGFGREYRERLRGRWGEVDVDDTIAAVRGLADAGIADPARLLIRGGSAGGWTVLSALTRSNVFAAGTSYYGVAELTEFARETHDFESRYLDGLIGPLPEAADLYAARAPIAAVDRLATPVLLLQGLDDPIVPPSQAQRFIDALASRGIPYAYRFYEGESHGFRRAETTIDALRTELAFYGAITGFVPVGVPPIVLL